MHDINILSESPSSAPKHSKAIFSMHRCLQTLTKDISDYSQSLKLAIASLTLPEDDHKLAAGHLQDLHSYFNVIYDSATFQENLVNQTPGIVSFNPKEIVTGLVSTYRSNKQITMIAECPTEEGKVVFGNLHNLKRILTNLISNAEKFTPPGGKITLALTYPKSVSPETDIPLAFSVRDTGPGMTDVVIQRIFTPYAQGGSEISGQYGGTGLGLATCKDLVKQMGGEISVSSIVGQGSNFTFTIACNHEVSTKEKTAPLASPPVSEQSILASMHDVRNTTGWLISYSKFTRDTIKALKKLLMSVGDIEKWAQTIEDCAKSQRHLITQTLDYSKLSLGKAELHVVNFNPEKIVSNIVAIYKKKIKIVAQYPQENKDLSGDSEKLKQILTNLINYAMKYTSKTAKITISFLYTDSPLTLEFKISAPVSGDLESKRNNANLDLPICQEIVTLMKGKISVSSARDQELIFTFTIPCQPRNPKHATEKSKLPSLPTLEAEEARALVVDDQLINRSIVKKLLQKLRYEHVIEAQNGEDALNKYSEFKDKNPPFHLILMDVRMSPMDGIEATGKIRKTEQEQKKIPAHIVALSGNSEEHEEQEAKAAGMNVFLVKPVTIELLKKTIPQINKKPFTLRKVCVEEKPLRQQDQQKSRVPFIPLRNTPSRSTSDGFGSFFYKLHPNSSTLNTKSALTKSVSVPTLQFF